jgi:hypothetical protein
MKRYTFIFRSTLSTTEHDPPLLLDRRDLSLWLWASSVDHGTSSGRALPDGGFDSVMSRISWRRSCMHSFGNLSASIDEACNMPKQKNDRSNTYLCPNFNLKDTFSTAYFLFVTIWSLYCIRCKVVVWQPRPGGAAGHRSNSLLLSITNNNTTYTTYNTISCHPKLKK